MKRLLEGLTFAGIGAMLASLAMAAHEVARRPEAICVPLYDRLPLECLRCEGQ